MTALDLITNALMEIGSQSSGEATSAAESSFALDKLNALLDERNARRAYVYAMTFPTFILTAGHAPHLIGPGLVAPDFAVAQRPVRIEGAAIILNTAPTSVDVPIDHTRDFNWWNFQRVKALQSSIPTDLYYEPDWPNGALNFWPVPSTNYGVRLALWTALAQFAALTDAFSLPPSYQNELQMTLAQRLAAPFGMQWKPEQQAQLMEARKAVQGNNAKSPTISTADAGMPKGTIRSGFNWLTGN